MKEQSDTLTLGTLYHLQLGFYFNCPKEGATFSEQTLGKSVEPYRKQGIITSIKSVGKPQMGLPHTFQA